MEGLLSRQRDRRCQRYYCPYPMTAVFGPPALSHPFLPKPPPMKIRSILLLSVVPAALFFTHDLKSRSGGILPTGFNTLTRVSSSSCSRCHFNSFRGGVTVTVKPNSRSILVDQSTAITVSGTSSNGTTRGGFAADVTKGTLVAGLNSRSAGSAITHSNPLSRSWTFNWKAPSTGGLAELYTVVNCVNGNGSNSGDSFSFHGSSPTNAVSTPVRLYANAAAGVKPTGTSCSDGFGNFSVLGAPLQPTIGNTAFKIEGFGLPPSSPLLVMLSLGGNVPGFDMALLGAPGCVLRTTMQVQFVSGTGAGNAQRAEGSFVLPLPIPNNSMLKNITFAVQFGVVDSNTKRSFGFTVTNGLECTIL